MNHVIAGKQLLMRRAAGADSKAETGIAMDKLCIMNPLKSLHSFAISGAWKNGYDSNAS
jgi:hypothetical protein